MLRVRFRANNDDWRPVIFPPPGPCWCSGYGGTDEDGYAIVVAYVEDEDQILKYWPEASDIDADDAETIVFTDRFARPDWWPEGKLTI